MGKFNDNGYKFSGEDQVLRVSKGSLVLMKGKKLNAPYILQGRTLTGTAAIVLSKDSDSETSQLWHMWHEHMSDKGMDMLSK